MPDKISTSNLNTLASETLGDLKPYQLSQVMDVLSRMKFDRGASPSYVAQPTISQIVTALGSNEP